MTPADWQRLGFTSGRRTYLGNKKVGGVANSDHLTGSAADFTAPLSAVRARFPNARILDEGDHRHVSGLNDVPYHGKRGTIGLVNGVDTTAPKGTAMIRPRKPQPKAAAIAPQPAQPTMQPEPFNFQAEAIDPASLGPTPSLAESLPTIDPAKPGLFGKGGDGWKILGVLGDGLSAYGGRQGTFAPALQQEREMQFDREKFNQELEARRAEKLQAAQAEANKPYRMQNNNGDALEIDPRTGQARVIYADPNPKTNWTKIENPDGSVEMRPTPGASRPQPDDIADLARDPKLAADFDAEFGPGMAQYYLRMGAR